MNKSRARALALQLVTKRHPNEESVRLRLTTVLEALGYDAEPEYSLPDGGRMDIFLPQRRAVIETKAPGAAKPSAVRDEGSGETQFEQCERYVQAEWKRERARLDMDDLGDLAWRAFLTDGRVWWAWQWEIHRDGELSAAKLILADARYTRKSADALVDWLASDMFSRMHGKPWAPRHPAQIFEPFRDELRNVIYPALKDDAGTRTKRDLWLSVLRASGCAPSGEIANRPEHAPYSTTPEGDDLFATHTTLIAIARAVGRALQDSRDPDDDPLNHVGEGFASWPFAPGAGGQPTHQPGSEWVKRVFAAADRYDWRARSRDVLRALYQDMVPAEQRQAFGEFYTPDWLAEMLAERLLDDDWLEESVALAARGENPSGVGVLDPACGSGTFLYHAARRVAAYMKNQGYQDGKTAEVAARLVYGIDIHPVAVEFSRANILRALPVDPPNGIDAVNVIQGDSLIYARAGITLANQENVPYYLIETPMRELMGIPVSWADRETFAADLNRFVQAANSVPPRPMPVGIATGLPPNDAQMVENTYNTLIEVCRKEKDSVWGWYFQNIIGPSKMRRRKVNRILANPPWVRMSHIQTPERKAELEDLADELGFWGHGKSNTAFDISSLFVKRCALNYLAPDGSLAAWLLPQGALDGDNWTNVREDPYVSACASERMDLGKVRRAPFSVESCVWLQTHGEPRAGQAQPETANADAPPRDAPTQILVNREDAPKIDLAAAWEDVKPRTKWIVAPKKLPIAKSGYLADGGNPVFRNAATLFPHCLMIIADGTLAISNGAASFSTRPSSKKPWSAKGALRGEGVPASWIRDAAFSTTLFPFTLRRDMERAVLPLSDDGDYDADAENVGYWVNAESVYQDGRGIGGNTPKTLWARMNFQNGLTRQTAFAGTGEGRRKVLYNKSGRIGLRAARVSPDVIAENTLYYLICQTETEAAYLAALLNADCLQEAYRQSQKTRRHFDHHFWHTVPIPKYDPRDETHLALAQLCADAETAANAARDELPDGAGQIKISAAIHANLRELGIAARIDKLAAKLIPNQAVVV